MADVCKVCGGFVAVLVRDANHAVDENGVVYAPYQWCPECVKKTAIVGYAYMTGEPYLLRREPESDTPVEVSSDG